MQERRWNAENFIFFQTAILKFARHVTGVQAIHKLIMERLGAWESGKNHVMVEDIARTCNQYLSASRSEDSEEQRTETFKSIVLLCKLRTAIHWIMEWDNGRVYPMGNPCQNMGETVLGML